MKRKAIVGGMTALIGLFGLVAFGFADEGEKKAGEAPADKAAEQGSMMEEWIKVSQTGPQHERLKEMVGDWKTEVKQWDGPGEPTVSHGTSSCRMIMDGRYLEEKVTGEAGGQPYEGRSFAGYDNIKQKYVSTWIDSMSTGIMMMEGTYDEKTETFEWSGEMLVPGGASMKMRMTDKRISKDKRYMEAFMVGPDGKEIKNMELTYTRS